MRSLKTKADRNVLTITNASGDVKVYFQSRTLFKLSILPICLVSFVLSVSGETPSPTASPSPVTISINPTVIQPVNGKLPTTAQVAVKVKDCTSQLLTRYSLSITGVGLSFSNPKPGICTVLATLTLDQAAAAGKSLVTLLDQTGTPIANTDITILDSLAQPIPPGLAPEVDVMWGVMSQRDCKDAYGRRVAQSLYCIQVKIGNNTGHPIQIAGLGFTKNDKSLLGGDSITPNLSYAATRSILQRESYLSGRNIIYNSIQATGLLMSSFIPFFVQPNPQSHFATAASIVSGAALQAMNIIAPDATVANLNHLDDQTFRDNAILMNNAHAQTVVFVEKRAMTLLLQQASEGFKTKLCSDTYKESTTMFESKVVKDTVKNSNQKGPVGFGDGDFDPLLVKLALGNLVIVGSKIDFLERIQIVGNPNSPTATITITPPDVTIQPGDKVQFNATIVGAANTAVSWSVDDKPGGDATIGTIDDKGNYTAPSSVPKSPLTVKATLASDSHVFAEATVNVTPGAILFAIIPPVGTLKAGGPPIKLVAEVKDDKGNTLPATVKWSVEGTAAQVGKIDDTTGEYTPPAGAPAGGIHVRVNANIDLFGGRSTSAWLTVEK